MISVVVPSPLSLENISLVTSAAATTLSFAYSPRTTVALSDAAETIIVDIARVVSEKGYFITNGKAIPVTWKKDGEFGVTHYYDQDGKEITLNKGKTWICVIGTDKVNRTEFYGK